VLDLEKLSTGCALEPWFVAALRHPISKKPLAEKDCRVVNGILDFRPDLPDAQVWKSGQDAYEKWEKQQIRTGTDQLFKRELESVKEIYAAMPIKGACLDVGGLDGRIRSFMEPGQRYACVDPYPGAIADIALQLALTKAYPALVNPVNFVCGMAEYLPIADCTFDTVHMRSVIDHMNDPAQALREAARVLRPYGQIVVGVSVEAGKTGKLSLKERGRETLRSVLVALGVERYRDHHVWHPTWPTLKHLIETAGFTCAPPYWQSTRVVYVCALKNV
jgi:SAM-dependent methyltransferase